MANLWLAFSVTADLASFGLPDLSKIARNGNVAAELAETAEEAKEIKRVADKANDYVKAETGKDVTTMSEKEFEEFVYRQDDRPHSPIGKTEDRVKSHVNSKGDMQPADVNGTTTVQTHVRGTESNVGKGGKSQSPYTSFSIDKLGAGTGKIYGEHVIELDIKKLTEDINTGLVKDVKILKHEEVVAELQEKINIAQKKVDINSSKESIKKLEKAKIDLFNVNRDKELLIEGVIPAKYITVKPQITIKNN